MPTELTLAVCPRVSSWNPSALCSCTVEPLRHATPTQPWPCSTTNGLRPPGRHRGRLVARRFFARIYMAKVHTEHGIHSACRLPMFADHPQPKDNKRSTDKTVSSCCHLVADFDQCPSREYTQRSSRQNHISPRLFVLASTDPMFLHRCFQIRPAHGPSVPPGWCHLASQPKTRLHPRSQRQSIVTMPLSLAYKRRNLRVSWGGQLVADSSLSRGAI